MIRIDHFRRRVDHVANQRSNGKASKIVCEFHELPDLRSFRHSLRKDLQEGR
jgi:hypothetical protein